MCVWVEALTQSVIVHFGNSEYFCSDQRTKADCLARSVWRAYFFVCDEIDCGVGLGERRSEQPFTGRNGSRRVGGAPSRFCGQQKSGLARVLDALESRRESR